MDEILRRIKRALDGREAGSSTPAADAGNVIRPEFPHVEEIREFAKKPEVRERILSGFVGDAEGDMFIKPVVKEPPAAPKNGVFRLTRKMRIVKKPDFGGVDFERFCAIVAEGMGRDLTLSYMSPKIEEWLRANLADCAKLAKP